MRHALLTLLILAVLAPAAQAERPYAGDLAWAQSVARTLVGPPQCDTMHVVFAATEPGVVGYMRGDSCVVTLRAATYWRDLPTALCETMVHEYAHFAIGPAFGSRDPSDNAAWHSPDPRSLVYQGGVTSVPQCKRPPKLCRRAVRMPKRMRRGHVYDRYRAVRCQAK